MLPPNAPLWNIDYSELKIFEKQKMQEGLSPSHLKAGHTFPKRNMPFCTRKIASSHQRLGGGERGGDAERDLYKQAAKITLVFYQLPPRISYSLTHNLLPRPKPLHPVTSPQSATVHLKRYISFGT